jgi:hypothetical protein
VKAAPSQVSDDYFMRQVQLASGSHWLGFCMLLTGRNHGFVRRQGDRFVERDFRRDCAEWVAEAQAEDSAEGDG